MLSMFVVVSIHSRSTVETCAALSTLTELVCISTQYSTTLRVRSPYSQFLSNCSYLLSGLFSFQIETLLEMFEKCVLCFHDSVCGVTSVLRAVSVHNANKQIFYQFNARGRLKWNIISDHRTNSHVQSGDK
jgi:hypothetical protein